MSIVHRYWKKYEGMAAGCKVKAAFLRVVRR